MQTIVFVPADLTTWHVLTPLAAELLRRKEVVIWFLIENNEIHRRRNELDKDIHVYETLQQISYHKTNHDSYGTNNKVDSKYRYIFPFRSLIKKFSRILPLYSVLLRIMQVVSENLKQRKQVKALKEKENEILHFFRKVNPSAVIVGCDRSLGYIPPLLSASSKMNIPVVIPPVATNTVPEGLAVTRRSSQYFASAYMREHFPNQVWFDEITERYLSYNPERTTIALHKSAMLSENPMVIGGGFSTVCMVDGSQSKNEMVKLGVPSNKIHITGHPEHDLLFRNFSKKNNIKDELIELHNFTSIDPLLICALPCLAEHNILSWDQQYSLVTQIVEVCASTTCNVLLSLHPRMNQDNYQFLQKMFSVQFADRNLANILPASDLFIVGQGSSTIYWASLCEIPTVVTDWYGLNYRMADDLEGVLVIKKFSQFKSILRDLSSNAEQRDILSSKHHNQKEHLAPFDGLATNRVIDLILSQCRK